MAVRSKMMNVNFKVLYLVLDFETEGMLSEPKKEF